MNHTPDNDNDNDIPQGIIIPAVNPYLITAKLLWKPVLFLLMLTVIGIEYVIIQDLKADKKSLQIDATHYQSEYASCKESHERLNSNIAALVKDSKKNQEKVDGLADQLDNIRKRGDANRAEIENQPTPETCDGAINFLRDNVKFFGN